MTPESVLKQAIETPPRRTVRVSTTLDYLVDSLGDYFVGLAQADGPVLTILDVASQPWIGLGAAAPTPDAGSATPAGSAAGFFVKGGQEAVSALVGGAQVFTEDFFIPDFNYGGTVGGTVVGGASGFDDGFDGGFG